MLDPESDESYNHYMKIKTLLLALIVPTLVWGGESLDDLIGQSQERHINSLKEQIKLYQDELTKRDQWQGQLASFRSRLIKQRVVLSDLRRQRDQLQGTINGTVSAYKNYRDESVAFARGNARGEKVGTLTLNNEKVLEDVVILKVNEVGLTVTHRAGRGRIDFQNLPHQWQERFFYDREKASLVRQEEKRTRARYERRLAIHQREKLMASKELPKGALARALRPLSTLPFKSVPYRFRENDNKPVSTWRERRENRQSRRRTRYYNSYYYNSPSRDYQQCVPQSSPRRTTPYTGGGRVIRPRVIRDTRVPTVR